MTKAAHAANLKAAFKKHEDGAQRQVKRLERIFKIIAAKPRPRSARQSMESRMKGKELNGAVCTELCSVMLAFRALQWPAQARQQFHV